MLEKNKLCQVACIDLTHEGLGVAKYKGMPIFIENLLPSEQAIVKIIKMSKSFAVGKVVEHLSTSPHRVPMMDKVGTWVGTMPLQHLSYDQQLIFKQEQVEKVLRKIAKLPQVEVRQTIGAEQTTAYRNKAQIPVREIDGVLTTGFFRKNSHQLVPIEDFVIQDKEIDRVTVVVRDALREHGVKAYNEQEHTGEVRHIVVRRGKQTGDIQVVIVTRIDKRLNEGIVRRIIEHAPGVKSVVQNINSKRTNVIMGEAVRVLYGEDKIYDKLLDVTFAISSRSFYQVNPDQTERLYSEAIKAGQLTKGSTVIDAYCGIGTIGLSVAKHVKHVYGMDIVHDAIEMANENAEMNGIENVTYVTGKAEEVMPQWEKRGIRADVMIVDPPRKGLDKQFIDSAIATQPERIVYISCNPATMARDIAHFTNANYHVEYVQPVDMFPMTVHVETIALIQKI